MVLSEPILATAEDGDEIARLHVRATASSDLSLIIHASADPDKLADYVALSTTLSIPRPYNRYVYIRDLASNRIVSYANWVLPHSIAEDEADAREFQTQIEGMRMAGTFPARPEGLNLECNREFSDRISIMRRSVLGDPPRACYLCANIATDPDFRRQGAATKLMRWPFEMADREGVACYLDTDPEGIAIAGYKKLGFVEKGVPLEMDLTKYGMPKMHRHVAMLREPIPHPGKN